MVIPHKIFSLALKGQATGTACSSLKFHFCLLGIPKTFCVVALEMKNKRAARNMAHLYIMFMMRAKIENPWHKNLADRTDGPNFFRPLNTKFADAKMKKTKKKVTNYGYFFAWKRLAVSCKGVLSALTEINWFCFSILRILSS